MRFNLLAAAFFACSANGLNVLLGNDDGFAASNIREFYRLLKKAGHDVIMVAPAENQSGQGGRTVFDTSPTLQRPAQYGIIPVGRDPIDSQIWYYNGTPAACTFVALDYVLPKFYPDFKPDLFVSGPNFGNNLGPFIFTLSGTVGSTYAAVGRDIPGIAFSGGNFAPYSYKNLTNPTASGQPDPATVQGQLAVDLVNQIASKTPKGQRIFPLGYGLNVNTPFITSLNDTSCIKPPFYQSRLTGGAASDFAAFNNGVFTYQNIVPKGLNADINGNFLLPGETDVINSGCHSAVSVFTVDYDAPFGKATTDIRVGQLLPLVNYNLKIGKRSAELRESDHGLYEATLPRRHE